MPLSDNDRLLEQLRPLVAAAQSIERILKAGITITLHHTHDAELSAKLDTLLERTSHMSASLDALTAKVAETKTIAASAVTLLQGLKAALDAAIAANNAGDNGAALDALAADLGSTDAALAAAITANTPTTGGGGAAIALPAGQLGVAYSATLDPITGAAPFTNTLASGALPDGLTLDSSAPVISGMPSRIGDFAFSVSITDSDPLTPDVVRNYTISIA